MFVAHVRIGRSLQPPIHRRMQSQDPTPQESSTFAYAIVKIAPETALQSARLFALN